MHLQKKIMKSEKFTLRLPGPIKKKDQTRDRQLNGQCCDRCTLRVFLNYVIILRYNDDDLPHWHIGLSFHVH